MTRLLRTLALMAVLGGGTVAVSAAAPLQKAAQKKDDKKDEKKKDEKKTGTFEVYKDKGGKFRFRIKDAEGTQLGSSHVGYGTKEDAEKVIKAIQEMAATAKVVEPKE